MTFGEMTPAQLEALNLTGFRTALALITCALNGITFVDVDVMPDDPLERYATISALTGLCAQLLKTGDRDPAEYVRLWALELEKGNPT